MEDGKSVISLDIRMILRELGLDGSSQRIGDILTRKPNAERIKNEAVEKKSLPEQE